MELFIAVKDREDAHQSAILGAFATEDEARRACQADLDEEYEELEPAARELSWIEEYADGPLVRYAVRAVDLGERTYC